MNTVKISIEGQITLPQEIREKFSLHEGDSLIVTTEEEKILLKPVVRISDMRGIIQIPEWKNDLLTMRMEIDE
ncbi:MAG: AbrB/MazE/SpoVT family DNA-binding domain-containing protein [Methanospirillaceae archaeon]|nr:AbrB/MazE/SpoVT family DNA-binding domain-containing protein [Methanospirillaceae archaeon]